MEFSGLIIFFCFFFEGNNGNLEKRILTKEDVYFGLFRFSLRKII